MCCGESHGSSWVGVGTLLRGAAVVLPVIGGALLIEGLVPWMPVVPVALLAVMAFVVGVAVGRDRAMVRSVPARPPAPVAVQVLEPSDRQLLALALFRLAELGPSWGTDWPTESRRLAARLFAYGEPQAFGVRPELPASHGPREA